MFKKSSILSLILAIAAAGTVLANGISLNNIGPRALGMSGAFVAIADDYTAVYWNPAGCSQLKGLTIGAFATDLIPMGTYKFDAAGIDAKTKTNHYISPNIAGYLQLLTGDLCVGLGAYVPAGLGAEWDGNDLKNLSGGKAFDWNSKIAVFSITPVVSYKLMPNLYFGAALNMYYGMMDMARPTMTPPFTTYSQYTEESNGLGFGFSAGLLYKPNDMLSVGFSFKTKATITMEGTAKNTALAVLNKEETDFSRDMSWPMWIAGGVAFKPFKGLTIAADVDFSQWSDAADYLYADYTDWGKKDTMHLEWEDAMQFRVGIEYMLDENITLRAGFYTDPAPAPDNTLTILLPNISYNGITVGVGYDLGNLFFDIGFEYLMGTEREITIANTTKYNMPGIQNMNIFSASVGAGIRL
jgi:long-chain fatty acid transport protein